MNVVLFKQGIDKAIESPRAHNQLYPNIVYIDRKYKLPLPSTGELGYDGPLYDRFLHMTDDMLGPSPMHITYSSYVYDGFCI